jgi:hypothetical protein
VTGKAGARYERVVIDGEPYFVKRLSPASDWIMRVTGDHVHRPYLAWRSGPWTGHPPASTTLRLPCRSAAPATTPC